MQRYKKSAFLILLLVLTIFISLLHFFNLYYERPIKDRRHYTTIAYNMLKYGVHSRRLVKDYETSPPPTYRRGPFYPFILMIGLVLHPGIDVSKQDGECIAKGKGECINTIIYLKIINIILLMSCAILGAYIVYLYSQSALFFASIFFTHFIKFYSWICRG